MQRPAVGKQVVVVTKGHGHKPVWVPLWNCFTPSSPETNTYTGTVMRPDHWLKDDEFNLSTDLPHFPVRTISLKNVISIDGMSVEQALKETTRVVTVKGSRGNEYEVTIRNGVAELCSCTGFHYRQTCRHLKEAK